MDRLRFGLVLTAVIAAAALTSSTGAAPAAGCSLATALEVGKPYFFDPDLPRPVAQVLCGAFLGPGSEGMAITFYAPTCWPVQSWALFAAERGEWRLVKRIPSYLAPPLVAVGNDIRETTAVARAGDPRCLPTGGTHARVWHWNGRSFAAGAWRQVTPPQAAASTVSLYFFKSPSGNLYCELGDEDTAYCRSVNPPHSVALHQDGTFSVCGTRVCGGQRVAGIPMLAYGQRDDYAGFRCRSETAGITCVVTRSGKGFMIDSAKVTRVGP